MIKLLKYMKKTEWLQFLIVVISVVADCLLTILIPEYMAEIIKQVQLSATTWQIVQTGLVMLSLALGSLFCTIIAGYFAARVSAGLCRTIRHNIYEKVGNFSMKEIDQFSTASLITRSTNDITQLQQTYSIAFKLLLSAPVLAICAIVKIVGKSWQLSLTTAGFVLFLTITLFVLMFLVFPKFKLLQKRVDKLNLATRENLTGIKVIRAYNAQEKQTKKFEKTNKEFFNVNIFLNKTMAVLSPLMGLVMQGLSLTIIWFGSYLLGQNILNVEDLMEFTQYSAILLISFTMLSMMFWILPRANVSAKRVREILNSQSSIVDGNITETNKLGTIEFKNVSFFYPNSQEDAIKNITFKIEKGKTLAIIGSTGSGKSTILNLIMRFYDASDGEILIDGVNIKEFKLSALYDKMGYAPQKSSIFSGSVKQNIGYGLDENKQINDVLKALKVSQSEEFVQKLENGIDAQISQGGNNISGGQKQRINIARALAKNPEFLLFDDSFSALDFLTDKKLRKDLKENYQKATKVIIAQRIGSIMEADKIIVLDEGKIIGEGTHDDLMKTCSVYQEIAYSQLEKEDLIKWVKHNKKVLQDMAQEQWWAQQKQKTLKKDWLDF